MKNKGGKNYDGFSLIELLFVIGLIVFLTAVSMPITLGFFNDQVLDESAIALKNNIKSARAKAMAGRASGFWGVRIEEDKYIIFNGKTFEDRNSARDIPVNLPSGVSFSRPNREIIFEAGSGKPFYDPSLVGHWEMDAGEGCMAYDYSGLGNHGLLNPDCSSNSPNWAEDKDGNPGRALEFDGSDDYISASDIDEIKKFDGINNSFSFSFWVKPYQRQASYDGFINFMSPDSPEYEGIIVSFAGSDTRLRVRYWQDGGSNIYWSPSDQIINRWNYIAVTIAENTIKIYQNGGLMKEGNFSNPFSFSKVVDFGVYHWSDHYFNGKIDKVRIYNKALSNEEINNLYQGEGNLQLSFQNNSVDLEVDEHGNVSIH